VKAVAIIREVPDTEAVLNISADGKSIDMSGVKFIINPYDEYAIEEAAQLAENNGAESYLIAVGGAEMTKNIRSAIAKGANKKGEIAFKEVRHLIIDGTMESNSLAEKIAIEVNDIGADIVLLGKQYIDNDDYLLGPFLANKLDIGCATVVTKTDFSDSSVSVEREIEGGAEAMDISFPAVLTLQKGVNDPRYAGMKGIMKAKKVAIDSKEISMDANLLEVVSYELPEAKAPGRVIEGDSNVAELVTALKEEAKVL
jgi:electron transfer flavoprotein beta subunit